MSAQDSTLADLCKNAIRELGPAAKAGRRRQAELETSYAKELADRAAAEQRAEGKKTRRRKAA